MLQEFSSRELTEALIYMELEPQYANPQGYWGARLIHWLANTFRGEGQSEVKWTDVVPDLDRDPLEVDQDEFQAKLGMLKARMGARGKKKG